MEVHVFLFEHRHGRDVTVHASAELAYAVAAEIARRDWDEARAFDATLPPTPPTQDVEAVERYFAALEGIESYEIKSCLVQGPSPAPARSSA